MNLSPSRVDPPLAPRRTLKERGWLSSGHFLLPVLFFLLVGGCQWFSSSDVPCYGSQHCPSDMECIQSDDGQGGTCEDRSWDDDDWGGGDDDDDATSGSCASDEIEDCDGHCGPLSWLGDGECDLGQYAYGGNLIDFNCAALSWDAGDCSGGNSGDDDDTVGDDDDSQSGPPETFSDVELSCYPYGTLQATLAFWAWSTGNTGVVRASIQTPSGSEACEFLVSYQGGGVSNKCFGPHAPSYCSTSGPSLPVNDSFYCTGADLWTDWTCSTPLVATFSLLDPTNWSVVWDSVQVSRP